MAPALTTDDACTVNPFEYSSHPIERFDIVVYEAPDDVKRRTNQKGEVPFLKRVLGLPGEKLEIRNNLLYINDQLIEEPFEKIVDEHDPKKSYGPITIAKDLYFVAGDNRPNSDDSRYNEHGLIRKQDIFSKVTKIHSGYYKGR